MCLVSDEYIYKELMFGGVKILRSCDPELGLIVERCPAAVVKHTFSLLDL